MSRSSIVIPLLLVAMVEAGCSCADALPPRVAVGQDAIAKSDLDGVWYFRQTVVGVPYETGFTFIGEQGEGELEKIRWDIQEDVLTARRAYEFVRGSEKGEPSQKSPQGYLGAPVAAFKIRTHFDIVREYNPSTGEEYNKIVENTERPWFERAFIRVDWSQNLISNFQFLSDWNHGGVSAIRQDPAAYYVSDPEDPDAVRIERASHDEPANYLEVTQKIVAAPESVDFEGFTNVPLCFLEYSTSDCASQEIKIRNSFMRAGERDYEPLVYDDHMMDRFGYFTTTRITYNRQYGETEAGRVRLINRFNIWQHALSETRCRSDAECGPPDPGVRCSFEVPDPDAQEEETAVGRCSLPYATRNFEDPKDPTSADLGPRKIVYYLNESFPADLVESARHSMGQYDAALRSTYQSLVGHEPPGAMVTLCVHNPVEDGDPPECGPTGTRARLGDLRYNMLVWVDEPTSVPLLGYGPSSHDPETGETIQAYAFVYGAPLDSYAAYARDIVRLVNGDIAPEKFVDGVNVKEWVQKTREGVRSHTFSQEDVDRMRANMRSDWVRALPHVPGVRKGTAKEIQTMARERSRALARSSTLAADRGIALARLSRLEGSPLERMLVNGEVLLARGLDPSTATGTADVARVRPLALANPEVARFMERERRRLSSHSVDMAQSFDDAIVGLALQQKGGDATEIWRKLRTAIFRSVSEHETGHSFGLRHNFAGSMDPMNYPKTYWDLRLSDGTLKPRYLDPEGAAEQAGVVGASGLKAGIQGFQYSSIMDYGSGFYSDLQGLGRYDRAALKFGYGQILEVFNRAKDPYLLGALQATVTLGAVQPIFVDCSGNDFISPHYSQFPAIVDLDDRSDISASKITRAVPASACAYPDEVDRDPQGHLVVPYKFCSDEFEGGYPGCAAYDRGADVFEVAANTVDAYRNYYLFNNFRRNRLGFGPEGYFEKINARYLEPLRSQMQFYVLLWADYGDLIPDDGTSGNFWSSPTGLGPYTAAVTTGFNLLGEILTAPEPGPYFLYTLADGREAYLMDESLAGPPDFTVSVPEGRFFSTEWETDSGYFFYDRVRWIGAFSDKVAALGNLTDPESNFIGKDVSTDARLFAINYYTLFAPQILDLYGATLTDRWDRLAPLWTGTAIQKRPISDPITLPPGGLKPVDPQIGFSVQLYASVLGMALIPATFDQSFFDSARIYLKGSGQQLDASKPKVTFTDPLSGKVYEALSYKDPLVETGIGARMLNRANELAALIDPADLATQAPLQSYVQLVDVVRSLSTVYSDPIQ